MKQKNSKFMEKLQINLKILGWSLARKFIIFMTVAYITLVIIDTVEFICQPSIKEFVFLFGYAINIFFVVLSANGICEVCRETENLLKRDIDEINV